MTEVNSQFEEYQSNIQEEGTEYINAKFSNLSIHGKLWKLNPVDVMIYFDATSLYPSAMYCENSVYPKIECGFAFETYMNDVYGKTFNYQNLTKCGVQSATLKVKYYNPRDLIFQHLAINEKFENIVKKQNEKWLYCWCFDECRFSRKC